MNWLKKNWKDSTFRQATYSLIFGAIIFDIAIWAVDGRFSLNAIPLGLTVLGLMYLIAYLKRNDV